MLSTEGAELFGAGLGAMAQTVVLAQGEGDSQPEELPLESTTTPASNLETLFAPIEDVEEEVVSAEDLIVGTGTEAVIISLPSRLDLENDEETPDSLYYQYLASLYVQLSSTTTTVAPENTLISVGPLSYGSAPEDTLLTDMVSEPDVLTDQLLETLNSAQGPPSNSPLFVETDGTLRGSGIHEGSLVNPDTFAPGNSPGFVVVTGDYDNAGGILEIEIGGTSAGTGYDQLQVSGSATLNGTLSVLLYEGFVPDIGDSFDIITFSSMSGRFDTGTGLFSTELYDRYFEITELADRIRLTTVALPGPAGFSITTDTAVESDAIGEVLNDDYFGVIPTGIVVEASVDFGDQFAASGTFAFVRDGTDLEIVGSNINFSFGSADTWNVSVNAASFGVKLFTNGSAWVEIAGAPSISSANFLSVSATQALYLYNSTGINPDGIEIGAGAATYTFSGFGGTANLQEIRLTGFDAEFGGNLKLSGDLSVRAETLPDSSFILRATASDVEASFEVGGVSLNLTGGSLNLLVETNGSGDPVFALRAQGVASLTGIPDFTLSGSISALVNTTGTQVVDFGDAGTYDFGTVDEVYLLGGDDLLLAIDGFVSIGGNIDFQQDGTELIAVGENVSATLSVDPSAEVRISGANFGLYLTDTLVAFETKNGSFDATLGPLANVSATRAFVQYTNAATTMAAATTLSVGSLSYTFSNGIAADTLAFSVEGFEADVADFVSLSGDIGFRKSGSDIVAVGSDVSASLEADPAVYVRLANADFGLFASATTFAFELKNGSLELALGPLANASATSVLVQYTNAATTVAAATTLTVGSLSYTFSNEIAADTLAFTAEGFDADIADFVSLSGDLGFRKSGLDIHAVGNGVDAALEISPTVYARLVGADFGLIAGDSGFAFEVKNGLLEIGLGPLANVNATSVLVQYSSIGSSVAAGTTLTVGSLSFTFADAIAANTRAFQATGFEADILDFVSLSGDIAFRRAGTDIVALGNSVSASLEISPAVFVRVNAASFGLFAGATTFAFELKNGALSVGLGPLANIAADAVFVQYTNASTTVSAGTILSIGSQTYTFSNAIAANTVAFTAEGFEADIAGFVSLSGNLGFQKSGSDILAVGTGVTAALEAGSAYARLTNADFGLTAGATTFGFELKNGALSLNLGPLANVSADSVFVQYTNAATTIAAATTLTVGSLSYTFSNAIAADTVAFTVEGFEASILDFVTLGGDIGFAKTGADIVAVGNGVSASLDVSPGLFVRLTNADFGLMSGATTFAFELTNGTLTSAIPLATLNALGVRVQYTNAATSISAGQSVAVGALSYTFADAIATDTIAFELTDAELVIDNLVTASADTLLFSMTTAATGGQIIKIGGSGLEFTVSVDGVDLLEFSNGTGGIILTTDGVAATLTGSVALLGGIPGVSISAGSFTVAFNNMSSAVNESISIGGSTIVIQTPAGPYLLLRAEPLEVTILGVTLVGDVGFQRYTTTGGQVMVVDFRDISIAAFSGEGTGGDSINIADAQGTFVILPNDGMGGFLEFTADLAFGSFGAGARVSLFMNNTGAPITAEGPFGALNLPATGPNSADFWLEVAVSFNFPGIEISGVFSYSSSTSNGGSQVILATQVEVFVGNTLAVPERQGLLLTNASGAFLDNGGVKSGYLTGTVSVVGIDGLVLSSVVTFRYNAATTAISDEFIVAGDTILLEFAANETGDGTTPFVQVIANDTLLDIADAISLSGDLVFTRDSGSITVTGANVEAFIGNGPHKTPAGVFNPAAKGFVAENLTFGMRINTGESAVGFALHAQGDAAVVGLTGFSLSGSMTVLSNTTLSQTVDFGGTLGVIDFGTAGELTVFVGENLLLDIDGFVTLSGDVGFRKEGSAVFAVGAEIKVELNVSPTVYVHLNDADFGLILDPTRFAFELKNGVLDVSIAPLASVTADSVTVRYTDALTTIAANTAISVGPLSYTFVDAIAANTIAFEVYGLEADVAGFVSLSGDFAFSMSGSDIIAIGSGVTASLEVDPTVYVRLANADFGLFAGLTTFAFELKNGELQASLGPLANASAASVFVQYTNAVTTVTAGQALSIGGLSYTFASAIAANTIAFTAEGFEADIAGFVSLSGNLGFKQDGTEIVAVGNSVSAALEAGSAFVRLSNADFGLFAGQIPFAFELKNGALNVALGSLAGITAANVFVQYSNALTTVTAGTTLTVGSLSYTFTDAIAANTIAFTFEGFSANIAGFVSLNGDIGFRKNGTEIVAVGENVSASLSAGSVFVRLQNADFGLLAGDTTFAFELSNGLLQVALGPLANISATNVFVQYSNAATTVAALTTLTVGSLSYTFENAIAADTLAFTAEGFDASIANFVRITGDLGFQKVGVNIIAVGNDVSASLEAGSAYVRLANADFGLRAGGLTFAFELKNGDLEAALGPLANISAANVFVQYSNANTSVTAGTTLSVGSFSYTFATAIAANTIAFTVEDLEADIAGFVSLSGDLGFRKVGTDIVAVGNNVSASLEASSAYVRLNDADFGLRTGSTTFAFELKNGSLDIALGPLANLSAANVFVQYSNAATTVSAGTTLSVGSLSYTFASAIAADTIAITAEDFEADLLGFVSLSGDLGFKKVGTEIIAVGENVSAALEASPSVYVRLNNADFGLFAGATTFAFELKNGSLEAALGPLANISADAVFVQYTNATTTVAAATTLSVGSLSYTFTEAIAADTVAITVEGFEANIAGFVSLTGDLGFKKTGADIIAVGESVSASLEASPSVYVRLNNADFGLISGATNFAFELQNGSLAVALGPLANISADSVFVQYTNAATTVAAATELTVGSLSYTFATEIAADTIAFVVEGFEADIAGFVSLSGNLGFKKTGSDIIAVGSGVSASLEASPTVYARLSNADFGLISGATTFAFELKNGSLDLALGPLANITADTVFVQYTNAATSVTAATTLNVGSLSYTFDDAIAADTIAFTVEGFDADILGFVSISGDIGFKKSGADIVAVGEGVSASLEASPSVYVRLNDADFGLMAGTTTFAFELKNGSLEVALGPLANINADTVFVQYTNAGTTVAAATTLSVGGLSYTFDDTIASNTIAFVVEGFEADIAGFVSLSGDLGFKKTGSDIIAVGEGVTASLETSPSVYVRLANADFGLLSGATTFAFELKNGSLEVALGPLANISALNVLVRYTNATTSVTAGTLLSVGVLNYTFADALAANTIAFTVIGFEADIAGFVNLSGSLGFSKSGADIIAVGENVSASLEAGASVYARLSNADFGLSSGATTFAFELKNGSLDLALGPLANITATSVFVQYTNAATTVAAATTLTVGSLSYTFDDAIAADTIAFTVEGFEADIAGFVSLSGDIGFKKNGSDIIAVGNGVSAALEASPSVYARLDNADFGLIAGATTFAFELKNGSLDLALGPLANITADTVFIQYTNAATSVAAATELNVGGLSYTFDTLINANTIAFTVEGFEADIAGFVTLAGDLGFKSEDGEIIAVGESVSASLEVSPTVYVRLSNADFGLIAGATNFAFELKNGSLELALGPLADIGADSVFVQYTNATTSVAAATTLNVGNLSYTFADAIAANTIAFTVEGFEANIADFVSLSGDLGFKLNGADLIAVGENVSASLEVNPSVYARVNNADFGLSAGATTFAFEVKNGSLDVALGQLANIGADSVFVQYTNAATIIAASTTLSVGNLSYTFEDGIAADTIAFVVEGFEADIAGFVSLSGDLGFKKNGTEIIAVGQGVSASLEAGASVYARLSNADFGLSAGATTLAFELKNGSLDLALGPLANITSTSVFVQYTNATTTVAADGFGNVLAVGENGSVLLSSDQGASFSLVAAVAVSEALNAIVSTGDNTWIIGGQQRTLIALDEGVAGTLLDPLEEPTNTEGLALLNGAVVMAGVAVVPAPVISSPVTVSTEPIQVTLTADPGVDSTHYSVDGNDPTTASTAYAAPFWVTANLTVKAVSVQDGVYSVIVSQAFQAELVEYELSIALSGASLLITLSDSLDGQPYQLQYSSNLAAVPQVWTNEGDPKPGSGTALLWTLSPIPSGTRAWRAVLP